MVGTRRDRGIEAGGRMKPPFGLCRGKTSVALTITLRIDRFLLTRPETVQALRLNGLGNVARYHGGGGMKSQGEFPIHEVA